MSTHSSLYFESFTGNFDGGLGTVLSGVGYGMVFMLSATSVLDLCRQLRLEKRRIHMIFLVIVSIIFVLSTGFLVGSMLSDFVFVNDDNTEEVAYVKFYSSWMQKMTYVIGNWLMDGLLIWRSFQILRICTRQRIVRWIVTWLLSLLCMASLGCGTVFLSARLPSVLSAQSTSPVPWLGFSLLAVSLVLNIIATGFIVTNLFVIRRTVVIALGKPHGSRYTYIVEIMVESAVLYSIFLVVVIILWVKGNSTNSTSFLKTLPQVQAISSLLIIMRVMREHESEDVTKKRHRVRATCNDRVLPFLR